MSSPHHEIAVVNAHPTARLRRRESELLIRTVLRGEGTGDASITAIFVDDAYLHDLNKTFLDHDWETDVVTFPIEDDPLEGEIYISVDRAREQAREYRVGFYDEIRRLLIHGTLHLLGYDDRTDSELAEMRRHEDRYLHEFGQKLHTNGDAEWS